MDHLDSNQRRQIPCGWLQEGVERGGSGASRLTLVALLILPNLGGVTGGSTSNLEDMACRIDIPLVLLFAALKVIGDSGVEDLVSAFEVILVRVSR